MNRGIHSLSNARTAGSTRIARNAARITVMQIELAKKQNASVSRTRIPTSAPTPLRTMASCAFGAELTGSWSKLFLFLELQEVAVILMLVGLKIHTVLPAAANNVNCNWPVMELLTNACRNKQPASELLLEARKPAHLTSL